MKYRSEIDGLRALAVLPVILSHAGFNSFSGGFVGVDVFFVISGYLITTIMIDDMKHHRFSLSGFYERRARRILPALSFVLVCCIPPAILLSNQGQLESFAKSLVATSTFSSNIFFWSESGYFDTASSLKPLLHTWSLGVEEQFYILFPLLVLFVWNRGEEALFRWVVRLVVVSLAVCIWSSRSYIDPDLNFYFLHTRAWELLAGSLVALIIRKRGVLKNELVGFSGLLLILISVFTFGEHTTFPGLYTLTPVLGTVCIILCATGSTVTGRLLSLNVFVGIGVISYSAYLWHQPILTFVRLFVMESQLNVVFQALSVLSTLIFAYLTWLFIESPIRTKKVLKTQRDIFLFALYSSFFLLVVGFTLYKNPAIAGGDVITKEPDEKRPVSLLTEEDAFSHIGLKQSSTFNHAFVTLPKTVVGNCKILILGDSHAGHLRGLSEIVADTQGCEVHIATSSGCPPLFYGYKLFGNDHKKKKLEEIACNQQTKIWQGFVLDNAGEYKTVVLSARWNWFLGGNEYGYKWIRENSVIPSRNDEIGLEDRRKNFSASLAGTVKDILSADSKVVIFSQPPMQMIDLRGFDEVSAYDRARPERLDALERQSNFDAAIKDSSVLELSGVYYAKIFDIFCTETEVTCKNRERNKSLYMDDDHLSLYGSYKVGEWFLDNIQHQLQ